MLEESLPTQPADESGDLQKLIQQVFQEIDRVDARIEREHFEIDRLKRETREMLAELKAA
jgi:hypothetical protein